MTARQRQPIPVATDVLADSQIRQLRAEAYEGDDETTICLCEAALLRSETARVHGVTRAEARQLLAERIGAAS